MEEAARMRAQGRDLIVLAQAMVDYAPPRQFAQALQCALGEETSAIHGYAPDPGTPELRRALGGYLHSSFGLTIDPEEEIIVTPGANHAAFTALTVLLDPGDEVLLISPWYFNHEMSVRLLGGCVRTVVARPEQAFVPRIADILEAWSERLRAVILVNPNNPTGARYPDRWTAELADALTGDPRWREVWILADQTYQEIFYTAGPPLSVGATALKDRTLTIGSFSKGLALAGWRLGFLTGPRTFITEALKVQDSSVICAPHAAQYGLAEALTDAQALRTYLSANRQLLAGRRDALLGPLMEEERLNLQLPEGACFAFLGLPEATDGAVFARGLLGERGVLTVPGVHFGSEWRSFLRLSFGSGTEPRLAEAGARIRDYLRSGA
jgi:aspartate aminotransferase